MHQVYLGLGTNLGNKEQNMNDALAAIVEQVGVVKRCSSFYRSQPEGFVSDNEFLNAVVLVETSLTPESLLKTTQKIEKQLGRTSKSTDGYTDRVIDIDILTYDNLEVNTPDLIIPHPLMKLREFVMTPYLEISKEV
jgi:2-amino-4-hydroxy-6-hydroxymethyldihydropteridine diphosphokinase